MWCGCRERLRDATAVTLLDDDAQARGAGGSGLTGGYSDRIPAMSSGSSVRRLVLHGGVEGYMVAVGTVEWPRPSTWPNSCAAMSSM